MRRLVLVGLLAVTAGLLAVPALADTGSVPIDTVVRDAPGTRHEIHAPVTPASLGFSVGDICGVNSVTGNNSSVHTINSIEVASVNAVLLVNVERGAGSVTNASGLLILGDLITFTLILGSDDGGDRQTYSGGMQINLTCEPPEEETTTTTTVPEVTTTVPDTTTTTHVDTPTTITAPPPGCPQDPTTPCGPVDAGGGAGDQPPGRGCD